MNIIYLSWGETPRSSGVYGSQVVSQITKIERLSGSKVTLIAGIPIVHSGFLREKHRYLNELRKIRKNLSIVKLRLLPIFLPQNFINYSGLGFLGFHILSDSILKKMLNEEMPDIVHCRSYHAAYAAISVRNRLNITFKIVFDPRGLWPEQFAVLGKKLLNSSGYLFLKEREKEIIGASDAIVSVSETMTEHFMELGVPVDKLNTIYPSCPNWKIGCLDKVELESKELTFGYLGALSEDSWHKPSVLSRLYAHLLEIFPKARLKIITQNSPKGISAYFDEQQLKMISFSKFSDPLELPVIMKDVNIGILSYFIPNSKAEHIFAKTVMAIKTGEYLSLGIPVIVNQFCGGAASYVEKYSVGISYNPVSFDTLTLGRILDVTTKETSFAAVKCSVNDFSKCSNAKKYMKIYQDIFR